MSILDRVIASVTPPESDEARREARAKAEQAARPGDWLSQVLEHHVGLERAFAQVKAAGDSSTRTAAFKRLAVLLNGHSLAEETVLYPALTQGGEKTHASMGYEEQAMVKVQMALLERLSPMSQDFIDKLEHIEGAVTHHMYAEEGNWFQDLKRDVSDADQAMLTQRYAEEYNRYVGGNELWG